MAALSEPMTADPSQHRQELTERLDTLRRNETFCDLTVAVKGTEFKAHKVVLAAASPFFLSLLESDMRESNEQVIRIELEEAIAPVMEDVLKYVYTGNVSVTEESVHNLIATADYLLLAGLKTVACNFLKENVTIENCIFNYYFADKYQCEVLKIKSYEVINSNFSVVMETDDFLNLDVKHVMEWVSSDDITVSAEEEVFEGIVKWVTHNKTERESDFPDLLRQVRLMSLSHDFLFDKLIKEKLITTDNDSVNFVLQSMESIFSATGESGTKPPRKCLEMLMDGIFVCGGRHALCYLPHERKWYEMLDMSFEHQEHAAVQHRGRVYIFSRQKVERERVAEYYMPSINSWGTIQTKYQYDEQFSSLLVLNDDLNLHALTSTEFLPENTVFTYNPDKNEWKMQGGSSLPRWGACGVTDGHHIYIIGGTLDGAATATVQRLDLIGESWEEVAAMNEARHNAFGAAMNGKIYIAGGLQKNGQTCTVLNTCEVYDPSTNEWQVMPSLEMPRHFASMVCFKEVLYVIGGLKDESKSRELSVEMFDSETNEWKEISTIPVCHESREERRKNIHFKACFATIHKDVLTTPIEAE